jgi:serine/threonine-protein kinase RsbT
MAVDTELDVSRVRRRAWDLARALGASSFAAQRVATAASELARNIVIHAGHGRVELRAIGSGGRRGMTVRAIDSGRGIENLERILAGNYRSKTGLGKGLLGVKRMSRRFDVQTSPTGTTVEADVALGLDPH